MPIHMSRTSKLGTYSWSLEARTTCPGSIGSDGELVPACKGCYAAFGNYRYPNVRRPRLENQQDWKRRDWVRDMVEAIKGEMHFRWFDSGDMYTLKLAIKILAVMRQTPGTLHWLPTRMHKFPKFASVLAAMQALPNVMVRPSSDSVMGEYAPGVHGSTILPPDAPTPEGVHKCGAYANGGKCGSCRACYDKSIPVIGYPAHGRVMLASIKRLAA
jgi:hypothetical protein